MPPKARKNTKPNPPRTVTTRATNATQHPGLIAAKTTRKPATASAKAAKANKAATAAAKAEAKELKSASLAKFHEDTMDREEMLEATPHPDITPTRRRPYVSSSGPSAAGSVVESDVDTDEVNPDKATYEPGSTTEDDSTSELSAVPTSPIKRTYAEVASPKKQAPKPAKAAAATSSKVAPPAKLAKQQSYSATESDSATEPDSPQPSRPAFKLAVASKAQSNTKSSKSAHVAAPAVSAPLSKSRPSTAAPTITIDPTTPKPLQKPRKKKIPSPTTVSETEPDSPPPKPKARSLQRDGSCRDLSKLDLVPKTSVTKGTTEGRSKGKEAKDKGKGKSERPVDLITSWKNWKADPRRKGNAGDAMDVDAPVKANGGDAQERPTTKKKASTKRDTSVDPIDRSSDIEIIENEPEAKGKGKGKEKSVEGKGKARTKEVEDADMGTSDLVFPTLPKLATSKRPHDAAADPT